MEGANRGVFEADGIFVACNTELPFEQVPNKYINTSEFWKGAMDWIENSLLKAESISPEDTNLLTIEDDMENVVRIIQNFHKNNKGL